MDQQQIQMVGGQLLQGGLGTGDDVRLAGVVVIQRVSLLGGEGDAALADDLHPAAQRGLKAQGVAEGLFALVATIDVGVIDGSDPRSRWYFIRSSRAFGESCHSIRRQ